MGALRIAVTMLSLLVLARTASAQAVDTAVFGPISDVKGTTSKLVADALVKARVGVASPKKIDLACTANVACVVTAGAEAGARRALAVTIVRGNIGFVLVDVMDKELISKRDVTIPDRKIAREFATTLKKFLLDAPTERARALFAVGNRHYELGEFPQALEVYKKAYRVKPLPAFQFNIAQCHRKLNQHQEAIQMYQAYLVGVPNADNKDLVNSLIAESRNQIATADKAAAEQARLDTEKKKAEEARLAAEAARKGKEAEAAAEAERRKQIQVKLDAERQRSLDKTYNKHPARKWMLVTTGLGLATGGAGVYFGMRSRKHQSAFDDANCGTTEALPQSILDQCRADKDQGRKDARLANILMATGGGVVLTSVLVFIIDPGNIERPRRERASVAVSPNSIQVVLRW